MNLNPDWIWKLHVLEPPVVSDAKKVIEEVELENLVRSFAPSVAMYASAIIELKREITNTRVAELIGYLRGRIELAEDATDEADILGEKLAGGPSKKKQDLEEFVNTYDSVKKFADALEKHDEEVNNLSIEEMLSEIEKKSESRDSSEINRYRDWIQILYSKRNKINDAIMREIYFEATLND